MSDALMDGGLKSTEAKVLRFLFKNNSGQSREIERKMDMRQPEVSSAMNSFCKRKWIKITQIKNASKGRPTNVYTLSTSKEQILKEIKDTIEKEIEAKRTILKNLETI